MNRSTPLSVLLSTAVGAVGGVLGIAWYVSNQVTPRLRRTYVDEYIFTPWELGVPYEDITFQTTDTLKLSGWWLPRPESHSVVIGCHGHIGGKHDLLGIGTGLWRAGHNVLLFDFRGRGQSDAWPNTLVSREVDDLQAATAYVRERLPTARIGVVGFSMGAAVALLAAARDPSIMALVADSSFSSATELLTERLHKILHVPAQPLVAVTTTLVEQRYGYRLDQVRPIDAMPHIAPRPVLIIHGAEDSTIPAAHAQRLFAAARQPKELWVYDSVEHCGTYFADRQQYVSRVASFFDQYLQSID